MLKLVCELCEYCYPQDFHIGRMIEFLDKMNNLQLAYVLDSCMNTNMDSSEIVGISVNKTNKYNEDLCDALWGAIKRDLET